MDGFEEEAGTGEQVTEAKQLKSSRTRQQISRLSMGM
jgi:hypothetical protein